MMPQLNPPAARRRRRKPLIAASGPARNVTDILLIILGSFITALTFNMFLLPNRIASGGYRACLSWARSCLAWNQPIRSGE